jgi:phage terminase large subunit-like protein
VHPIDAYADAVVSGAIPAGKYHRLACVRHQRDREREGTPEFPYRLDIAKAERFLRFGEQLRHYKGEWAGKFIRWQPYQVFRLGSVFGWVHVETGLRRFRNAYNELPRKQGKSLEAAVVAIYVTFFDEPDEPGAEGYCAATKRDQAKIVFNDAKRLVERSGLHTRLATLQTNMSRASTASKLEPIGADVDSTDGLNPHFINMDELHAYKTRGMIDVLETATGARRQPLIYKITTAGSDLVSPCGDEHRYACELLEGTLTDETYFAFIAHADPDDDWTAEATARKANPNYGVSVNPDDLLSKRIKAIGMHSAAATYKQKHLNLWVSAFDPWLAIDGWALGQTSGWTLEDMRGEACVVGIDLASKQDLAALVALFAPTERRRRWAVCRWVFTPEETLARRAERDRAPYLTWVEMGVLIATPGHIVKHQVFRDTLQELSEVATIRAVGFDPWHAEQLQAQLTTEDGYAEEEALNVPQTFAGMSSGCKAMEAEVSAGAVDAGGCPLMLWCAGNAVVMRDNKDNIYPVKRKSRGRIDPIVALAIAWNLQLRLTAPQIPEDPDLVVA